MDDSRLACSITANVFLCANKLQVVRAIIGPLAFLVLPFAASAQADPSTGCLPPAYPIIPSDPTVAQEYRSELSREFDDYFRFAAEYLNCLHAAETLSRQEIAEAIEAYQGLLNSTRQ